MNGIQFPLGRTLREQRSYKELWKSTNYHNYRLQGWTSKTCTCPTHFRAVRARRQNNNSYDRGTSKRYCRRRARSGIYCNRFRLGTFACPGKACVRRSELDRVFDLDHSCNLWIAHYKLKSQDGYSVPILISKAAADLSVVGSLTKSTFNRLPISRPL